jgi:hypothetical protein
MQSTSPQIPTDPKTWTYNGVGLTRQGSPKCGYYFDLDVKTGDAVAYSCAVDSGTFWSPTKGVHRTIEKSIITHSFSQEVRRRTRVGARLLLLFACRNKMQDRTGLTHQISFRFWLTVFSESAFFLSVPVSTKWRLGLLSLTEIGDLRRILHKTDRWFKPFSIPFHGMNYEVH